VIIEAISFKLALDFFKYLKKNRIYSNDIKIDFFDRARHEYYDFTDVDAMQAHWDTNYRIIDNCILGDLGGITFFRAESDTYNFNTNYKAIDVLDPNKYQLLPGAAFDGERNKQRQVFKDRQKDFINKSVAEYLAFYNELKYIYITGIYSPCYAEPGWSENTWYLKSLRGAFLGISGGSQFPYSNAKITQDPPDVDTTN
tara:strand:- start:37 stop:633 length:597 start_codon:yes stop_codon:yes gene_type:complete